MNLVKLVSDLDSYREMIAVVENMSDHLNGPFATDTMINYKDALCHYVKCYEAYNDVDGEKFLKQESNIYEHLERGLKDDIFHLTYLYCAIITYMMGSDLSDALKNDLRKSLHEFKNLSLDIRINGIFITRILQNGKTELSELRNAIYSFEELVHNNDVALLRLYNEAKKRLK